MTKFVILNSNWINGPINGYSFGLIDNDQFWDFSAQAFSAAPSVANAVRPLTQSGSPAHKSKFFADIPDIVNAVAANVIVYFHAPTTGGSFGQAFDGTKLKASTDSSGTIRPVTITTTVS